MRIAALLLMLALPSAAVRADVVSDWITIAEFGSEGQRLPPTQRDQTQRTAEPLVALAVFEAANMVDPRYRSYLGLVARPGGDPAVAAATAAHAVLVRLRPERKDGLD